MSYQIRVLKSTYKCTYLVPTGGGLYLVKPWNHEISEDEIRAWYITQIINAKFTAANELEVTGVDHKKKKPKSKKKTRKKK